MHLDFETRSELDIWKVGAWNYSMHPSTEILCMAYAINRQRPHIIPFKDNITPAHNPGFGELLDNLVNNDFIFTAHYSMFENYIWHNILVKRYGWPEIPLRQWRCTAALAASHALPRALDKAAKALGTKHQKDLAGKAVMLKMCKPRKPTKHNKAKWHESPEDFQKLYDYCIDDEEVEREIDQTLPALNNLEQEVWFLDQKINTRGIQVDTEAVDAALYLIEKFSEECNSRLKVITGGFLDKASQVQRIKNWMKTKGVVLPDLTKDSVTKALADGKHPEILEALKIRQQIGKTSVKKFQAFKNATCGDGRVRDMFVYHGASTGRWAGKIVQLHNLPRGNLKNPEMCIEVMKWRDLEKFKFLYKDVMGAISSCVRGALIAAPGKDLLVVDFAAIEARVVAWVAGQLEALKEFADPNIDPYVNMAKVVFGDSSITKEKDPNKRFIGKQAVLGGGFGMGWEKFKATCESEALKLGMNITVTDALAKATIKAFRKKNHKVKDLWEEVEKAAIEAVRYDKKVKLKNSEIQYYVVGDFLYCQLPSGRKLAYHHPKIKRVPYFEQTKEALTFMGVGKNKNYLRQQTWGGTLVENFVQAIARDFLVEAMLRVEKKGFKLVLHVHDEPVAEVDEWVKDGIDFKLKTFIMSVKQLPSWAKGCPIDAEGFRTKRYRKD